jgi:hypothetical protein
MSINHLLNEPELDIVVKSINVGNYNATPFNQVKTDPSEAIMYYENTVPAATQKNADVVRYHISRNGDFIDVTGYTGWDFPTGTLKSNQDVHFDIVISHPEVDSAYTNFASRAVASATNFESTSDIGFRLIAGLSANLAVPVAGTDFNTTIRQSFAVGSFTGNNNVLCSFKYSILCKTK